MPKKYDYSGWSKEDLIKRVHELEKRKKYGLVWDEERELEQVVLQCKKELPVLKEVKEKEIKNNPDKPTHILIEGDNYHALSVLNYTHEKSIDIIYIDPPYNTGARDWKYNNNYVDNNDSYRHSKWLSLMNNRLKITKSLLKEDGVLVIAIDDNEVHRLRLLIEDIFPDSDTTSITVVQNPRGNITKNFARTHEYALFVIPKGAAVIERLVVPNKTPRKLRRWGHNSERRARPTMFYPIYIKDNRVLRVGQIPDDDHHPDSKNIEMDNGEIEIWPIDQNGIERRWNFGLDKINNELDRIKPIRKKKLVDLFITDEITVPKTVWTDPEFEAGRNGATLVRKMTQNVFPYPKSIFTVKRCIELVVKNKHDAIILDYFAGSATTGHAVLELNESDNGRRQAIICTNNENNIAHDITFPRMKSAVQGYGDADSWVDGIKENLKYYTTDFVPAVSTDENKGKLTRQSIEMLCLRENTFEPVLQEELMKIFQNKEKYCAILFDQLKITKLKKIIKDYDKPVHLYIFSLGDDDFADEFLDMKDKVTVKSIPAAILRVYRRIFK